MYIVSERACYSRSSNWIGFRECRFRCCLSGLFQFNYQLVMADPNHNSDLTQCYISICILMLPEMPNWLLTKKWRERLEILLLGYMKSFSYQMKLQRKCEKYKIILSIKKQLNNCVARDFFVIALYVIKLYR